MALSPITLFQSNQTSLAQILQGGNQTVSGIMDRAIQVGRDISNKQLAQERDMLAMRQQETALQQRRGENLQQNWEDSYRFARGAFESDRNYGLQQQQLERQSARDLFSQGAEMERIGIAREGLEMRRDEMTAEQQAKADERARAEADRNEMSRLLGGGDGEETSPAIPAIPPDKKGVPLDIPAPSIDKLSGGKPFGLGRTEDTSTAPPVEDILTPAETAPTVSTAPSSREADLKRIGELEVLSRSKNLSEGQRAQANSQLEVLRDRVGTSKTGGTAAESLEMRKQAAAQKAAEDTMKTYVMDTRAFVRPKEWALKGAGDDPAKISTEVKMESEAYDKDPVAAEKNYAINAPSVQAYVDKVKGLSPVQYEKRRKFAEWARNEAAAPEEDNPWDAVP